MEEFPIEMSSEAKCALQAALQALSLDPGMLPAIDLGFRHWLTNDPQPRSFTGHCWADLAAMLTPDYSSCELIVRGRERREVREGWLVQILGHPVEVSPSIRGLFVGRKLRYRTEARFEQDPDGQFEFSPPPDFGAVKLAVERGAEGASQNI